MVGRAAAQCTATPLLVRQAHRIELGHLAEHARGLIVLARSLVHNYSLPCCRTREICNWHSPELDPTCTEKLKLPCGSALQSPSIVG